MSDRLYIDPASGEEKTFAYPIDVIELLKSGAIREAGAKMEEPKVEEPKTEEHKVESTRMATRRCLAAAPRRSKINANKKMHP